MNAIWEKLDRAAKAVQNERKIAIFNMITNGENEKIVKLGQLTPE